MDSLFDDALTQRIAELRANDELPSAHGPARRELPGAKCDFKDKNGNDSDAAKRTWEFANKADEIFFNSSRSVEKAARAMPDSIAEEVKESLEKAKAQLTEELTCTDDQYWEAALLEKWRKYGPLLQLLKDHGHEVQLHVIAVGRTGTVYEHSKRALNKMGMNNKEAEKTLRNLSKMTIGYANSMYWLHRKRIEEQRKQENSRKKDSRMGQDHPT
ncbi:hypothetical protein CYMTET_16932 [Cymbomonas tetramitiformis]|uniref:Uncharacterized protein n=1 Tax=Cymbomonas tetramitiformis TaxID=36881 RepID=A0AAE0GBD6_9CHLO|nr:hypothetical protein CYMTET_16932 [Cymbomonas tetramitiformis]